VRGGIDGGSLGQLANAKVEVPIRPALHNGATELQIDRLHI